MLWAKQLLFLHLAFPLFYQINSFLFGFKNSITYLALKTQQPAWCSSSFFPRSEWWEKLNRHLVEHRAESTCSDLEASQRRSAQWSWLSNRFQWTLLICWNSLTCSPCIVQPVFESDCMLEVGIDVPTTAFVLAQCWTFCQRDCG